MEKDKILLKTLAKPSLGLLKSMLAIDAEQVVPIPPILRQTILERQTDTLLKVRVAGEKPFILHWEYQSTNDSKMIMRMAIYDYLIYEEHKMDVKSVVIYIGQDPLKMKNTISFFNTNYSCDIIDIKKIDPEIFLQSSANKEVILALLAGADDEAQKGIIIQKIFTRLRETLHFSNIELMEKAKEMEYLAQLRGKNIQELIFKETEKMAVILDPKKSLFYIKGQEERELDIARNMIRKGISSEVIHECTNVTMNEVIKLTEEIKGK